MKNKRDLGLATGLFWGVAKHIRKYSYFSDLSPGQFS